MFREHGLPWKIVGFFSLALAPPGLTAQAQQVPQGLDEALSGQVAAKPEPKREIPRIMLAPEFWSPSPSQNDFIKPLGLSGELRPRCLFYSVCSLSTPTTKTSVIVSLGDG